MSEIPTDYRERLDLKEQLARIDRSLDEAAKFRAEQNKLMAERDKFNRDPWILTLAALIAALAAFIARAPELLHAFGVGP